jgi:hypothetical protein
MNVEFDEPLHRFVGSCHCGRVEFEFHAIVQEAVSCNCTYCRRKAALHLRVPGARFAILSGVESLISYRFGTERADHRFCRYCGVHTHCHPRSAPDQVNINLRCVDDLAGVVETLRIRHFDGLSW